MRRLIFCLSLVVLCCGCAVAHAKRDNEYQYPKASSDANMVIVLQSNIEKTAFYVDDQLVVTGKRVKLMINDRKEHVIKAIPSGYVAKEEFIQPPYSDGYLLSFTYMLGDRVTSRQNIAPAPEILVSDLDKLPQFSRAPVKNRQAIVIGIEAYRQKLPPADFAANDARLVTEYLTKALGFPEENVITLINDRAAKSDLEKYFEKWLKNNVEKDGTVFIYYSGHGAPNTKTGDAYLVPYDGDPTFIEETGYSLKRLYEVLGKLPAKQVVVVLDSCFSGAGGKSVLAEGARPLVMNTEKGSSLSRNMLVMTASSSSQISTSYKEKGHGIFTYFFLKGIKEQLDKRANAKLTSVDLYNYLKPQVEQVSRKQFNSEQTPQLKSGDERTKNTGLF